MFQKCVGNFIFQNKVQLLEIVKSIQSNQFVNVDTWDEVALMSEPEADV